MEPQREYLRPRPPGPDDLVILARDDEFYLLKASAYRTKDHVIEDPMLDQVRTLVAQGVALADIPVGSIPGAGAMCYLVNLSGFRPRPASSLPDSRPEVVPPPLAPDNPCLSTPAPAMDDLVIAGRETNPSRQTFYWVKKCEYERDECRLDQLDPMLEEQVRLLTNQGVVIADVPGGTILGVNDMGCLVNLKAIHRPSAKVAMEQKVGASPQRAVH